MSILKGCFACALFLELLVPVPVCAQNQGNPTPNIGNALPPLIQELVDSIQEWSDKDITKHFTLGSGPVHHTYTDLLEMIKQLLGPPREVGSGTLTYQWDVGGGVLEMPEFGGAGPSYTSEEGQTTWLLRSENPVGKNLLGHYELFNGVVYIGNLILKAGGKYQYISAGTRTTIPLPSQKVFFDLHPVGSFDLELVNGITTSTLLESLSKTTTIATCTFMATEGSEKETWTVTAEIRTRGIVILGPGTVQVLQKRWDRKGQP